MLKRLRRRLAPLSLPLSLPFFPNSPAEKLLSRIQVQEDGHVSDGGVFGGAEEGRERAKSLAACCRRFL